MDNEQLVTRIRAGVDTADNMLSLYDQNYGFIHKMALRYSGYAEMEDLKQEAYFGLCAAVEHYDEGKGVTFISYAGFWIKQTMQRYIDNHGGVVRLPVHAREWMGKYKKMLREYRQYYGCEPSGRELCHLLGIDREKLHVIQENARIGQIKSLSEVVGGEEEDFTIEDTIASDEDIAAEVAERLDTAVMKKELWIAVDQLPKEQAEVIRKRYQGCMTLKELGEVLGIAVGAVKNLESKAMRTLRMPHRCRKFKCYFEQYISAHSYQHVGVENFHRTWTSEVEREALREFDREEQHRRIMEEADRVLLENARIREMLRMGSTVE